MNVNDKQILKKVLALSPIKRAELVEKILFSLDHPDKKVDELWAEESEDRINSYYSGKTTTVSLERVLSKLSKK